MLQSLMKKILADSLDWRASHFNNKRGQRSPVVRALQNFGYAVFYLAAYVALSSLDFLYTVDGPGMTPWHPAIAASIALLLTCGLSWSPLIFVAPLCFRLFFEHTDMSVSMIALAAACEAIIYTIAVWLMKRQFKIDFGFGRLRDIVIFSAVTTLAAACMAVIYVLTCYFTGRLALNEVLPLMAEYGAGDSLGVFILTPLFLLNLKPAKIKASAKELLTLESFYQLSFTVCLVMCVFWFQQQGIFIIYTLFIPVVWAAVRNGLSRVPVILVIVQSGIALCSWRMSIGPELTVKFLPFIMVVIAWTGLILGSVTDERERLKLSNVKSDARLKAILDMAPDSMMIVDMQGHVVTANKNFIQMYGIETPYQITGTSIEKIIPAFYPELNGETFILLADGTDIPVEVSSSKVPVGDKYSSILTVRDITSRKNAESQMRQRRAATEQVTRTNLTGGLAAVLAHELNQPLAAIVSYASACINILATTPNPPPRVAEQLAKVAAQAQRAGDIIRRLREFFHNSNIDVTEVNIAELIDEALMLLEDDIMGSQVDVEVQVTGNLVAAIDRVQIEQVLINLIKNSLEALKEIRKDEKRIRITASLSMRGDIEMTVTDTGPGIAPEIADQLFSPFVTTRLSGMGLGLTISRSIVEAHNGRLWAELQSSSGAAMHFTIPAQQEL